MIKKNARRQFYLVLAILIITIFNILTNSSCKAANKIIEKKEDPYLLKGISLEELEDNIFYIKQGTLFYSAYTPTGINLGKIKSVSASSNVFLGEDNTLVPSLYKGEIIAWSSTESNIDNVLLERFVSKGYSVGIYNAKFIDNCIYYDADKSLMKESINYEALKSSKSPEARIAKINDQEIEENSKYLSSGGVVSGFDKGEKVKLSIYEGTKFLEKEVECDIELLESFEIHKIDKISSTKNGYIELEMPSDIPSGYYLINGIGLFKYYDFEKGSKDEVNEDMSKPFYKTTIEQSSVYSKEFSVTFKEKVKNVTFEVPIINSNGNEYIKGSVFAPDETEYDMAFNDKQNLILSLETVMAGKWKIFIHPDDVQVGSILVYDNSVKEEATSEVFTLAIDEPLTNTDIRVYYEGEGEIYGHVVMPDGTSEDLLSQKDNKIEDKFLSMHKGYLKKGIYTIRVFHYLDTRIGNVDFYDSTPSNVEIITVDE